MKSIFLLFVVSCSTISVIAQTIEWTRKFNGKGNSNDAITAMATDPAGNVYVTGFANNGATGTDYVTIKYNTSGAQIWRAVYDGPGNGDDVANAIFVDQSGNAYVTGTSDALTGAFIDNDATTIKYNSNGKLEWVARYDGNVQRSDVGRAIKVDAAGNVYITGYTSERIGAHSNANYLTVKYNPSGKQQWKAIYAGTAQAPDNQTDSANAIALDAAGNVYVTGVSNGTDGLQNLNQDFLTVKYNPNGVEQWTARYNGTGQQIDEAFGLVTDTKGNIFVTGLSTGAGNNSYDFATIKYNTNGVLQWVQRHNGSATFSADFGFAIAIDDADNIYVTGTEQARQNNEDIYTIKYNNAGTQQWFVRYDGGDNDDPFSIALDKQGNIYVAGYTTRSQTFIDGLVIKYNSNGKQQWAQRFKGAEQYAWDLWNAVAVDSLNNVYVAGYTTNKNSGTDYTVVKYSQNNLIANAQIENKKNNNSVLLSNIPNPFYSQTKISFHIYNEHQNYFNVKLWIEDAQGNKLYVLLDKKLTNGDYEATWEGQNYKPGLYYCKLLCNGILTVKEMLLIK